MSTQILWFATRGSGIVSLILFSAVACLGLLAVARAQSPAWPRFLTVQVWLMVLFLVYVTIHELNALFGDGELYRLFFRWRSSQAKRTRRQRIRLLTRLSRLTEANAIEAFLG